MDDNVDDDDDDVCVCAQVLGTVPGSWIVCTSVGYFITEKNPN